MDLKILVLMFLAFFLNTVLVIGFLFWFLNKKINKNNKNNKKRYLINKIILYKRLNFLFFVILLIVGGWLFLKINPKNLKKEEISKINQFDLVGEDFMFPSTLKKNGLNFVFYADQYENWDNFNSDVNILMEGLKGIEPFTNFDNINIFKINPKDSEVECLIKTENERKPVLRCNEKINEYLNRIATNDFKLVVLSRQEFQSWANLTRDEKAGIFFSVKEKIVDQDRVGHAVLFSHLVGHTFGLKDEEKYVLARAGGAPHTPDGPNCAPDKETAEKWWGDLIKIDENIGYFNTCCGSEDYIKPTESSIMNLNSGFENFSLNFGLVSEIYLRKILDYCYSDKKIKYEDDKVFFDQYPDFKGCVKK